MRAEKKYDLSNLQDLLEVWIHFRSEGSFKPIVGFTFVTLGAPFHPKPNLFCGAFNFGFWKCSRNLMSKPLSAKFETRLLKVKLEPGFRFLVRFGARIVYSARENTIKFSGDCMNTGEKISRLSERLLKFWKTCGTFRIKKLKIFQLPITLWARHPMDFESYEQPQKALKGTKPLVVSKN